MAYDLRMSADRAAFHFEVIKLLFRIALADEKVEGFELAGLQRYAERHGLTAEARAALQRWIDGETPSPPDLERLRARRQQVLIAVQAFLLEDTAVTKLERRLLARIEQLL